MQDVVPITSYDTTGSLLLLGCDNGCISIVGMDVSQLVYHHHLLIHFTISIYYKLYYIFLILFLFIFSNFKCILSYIFAFLLIRT